MDEKVLDDMLDSLIADAGTKAIENLTKEDLANKDIPEFEFSKEHEEKMQEIIENAGKEFEKQKETFDKNKQEKKTLVKQRPFRKIFLVAAAVILLSGLAISSVGAWRESFVSLFLNNKTEYSDVQKERGYYTQVVDDIYFGYVPNGYQLDDKREMQNKILLRFEKEEHYIMLDMKKDKNGTVHINTENRILEELVLNDIDMVYTENDELKMLTWYENGIVINLYTNDDKDVLIKIAKNIVLSK